MPETFPMGESGHVHEPGDDAARSMRTLLRDTADDMGHSPIDAGTVLARSRRRRLPGQLAAGGIGALAIAGIGFAGVNILQSLAPASVLSSGPSPASDSGAESGATTGDSAIPEGGISLAPAEKINTCGGTVAEIAPTESGLVATPGFPERIAGGTAAVAGTVTVTNTGTERVTGYTGASPAMTLSQDGITLWHSNGPQIALALLIDLEPGASMELPASVTPVRCDIEDDSAESFRDDLPALASGSYLLSAIFYLVAENAGPGAPPEVVSGPAATITVE